MEENRIYEDIAQRTDGDIYIGVVGPVRTGKSTFIKRFMETLVIPHIDNVYRQQRARDELPQSGSGRTIMTAEPKFVPEEAVPIVLGGGAEFRVRLIDCVGYLVDGAMGQAEGESPRMVTTPWFDHDIPMTEAAEIGTQKVIAEHATIGIVITTDGSITEIPREDYLDAEERVITELKELGKPFLVVLNSSEPQAERAEMIRADIAERFDVTCITANCLELDEQSISEIIRGVLYEFPVKELNLFWPSWVDALPAEHLIRQNLYAAVRQSTQSLRRIRDVQAAADALRSEENITRADVDQISLGTGIADITVELPRSIFYHTISEETGFQIQNDGDLLEELMALSGIKAGYDQVSAALNMVKNTGYGIVSPALSEIQLEKPELIRQGGRCGVRLRASAPAIHMIRADIKTELSPFLGDERQSEEMVQSWIEEFQSDTEKIWNTNMFGKSLSELISEDLNAKAARLPDDARTKLQETLSRIINEGSGGLICIIL